MNAGSRKVAVIPAGESGVGGPASFRVNLRRGLERRGVSVTYESDVSSVESLLVVAGTRRLDRVLRARRAGVRVAQRLNGRNWRHRIAWPGVRQWAMSEVRNRLVEAVRKLADVVIYQSEFSRRWWTEACGAVSRETVIHNGTDHSVYHPDSSKRGTERILLCVEGNIDEHPPIPWVLREAHRRLRERGLITRTRLVGNVSRRLRAGLAGIDGLEITGPLTRQDLATVYRSADLFLSLDVNASCPNAVIEAMSSGVPVVAFDTGSLPELLGEGGGLCVPYGADPWKLERPDVEGLVDAAERILSGGAEYRDAVAAWARPRYSLETMVDRYAEVILGTN